MRPHSPRLFLAAALLPLILQGCGGGGGGDATPPTFEPPTINPVISQWPAGTSWTYRVVSSTGGSALTRTMVVRDTGVIDPIDNRHVLELRDTATDGTTTEILNDYYFRQDATGTIYLEGLVTTDANNARNSLFIRSPGTVIAYPSPMQLGQIIDAPTTTNSVVTPFTITLSNGATQTVPETVVTGTSSVPVPIGPQGSLVNVSAFVLTQHASSTNSAGVVDSTTTSTYFNPAIGIVEIQVVDTFTQAGQTPITNSTTSILTSTTLPH